MLLVDDGQAEVLENHVVFNQGVGSDEDTDGAVLDAFVDFAPLRRLCGAGKQRHADRHVAKHLADGIDGGSTVADKALNISAAHRFFGGMLHVACCGEEVQICGCHFCGKPRQKDFVTLFETLPRVDAGLAASIFHFGEVAIPDLKAELKKHNIPVREV